MPEKNSKTEIILASSSSYRAQCLSKLLSDFHCVSPNIDESPQANEQAQDLARRLSIEKAHAVAQNCKKPSLIIASDQTASCNGNLLNKPGNFSNAKAQLMLQSGKTVHFHTGLALINTATGEEKITAEDYSVTFKQLTEAQIEAYLHKEQPYDCAGSFKSEALGIALFEKMSGRDPNTLIGLPLIQLSQWLAEEGLDPLLN
jgi:septum formation protein